MKKILITLAGLVAILVLLEIFLILTGMYYNLHKISLEKNDNEKSSIGILCIGDSFTAGEGAKQGEDYPSQLQLLLNKKYGKKYKVYNKGTAAQNSSQTLIKLQDQINEIKPDIVVVLTGGANQWNHWAYKKSNFLINYLNDILYNIKIFKLGVLLYENLSIKEKISQKNILEKEKYKTIISEFNIGIKKNKFNADLYYKVGAFFMYESDINQAITWFNKGILTDKKNIRNYLGLGAAYYELSDFKKSIKYLKNAHLINPSDISIYNMFQHVYIKNGDLDSAIYWTEIGIKKNPDCKNLYIYLSKFETISDENKSKIENFFNENPPGDNMNDCFIESPIVGGYERTDKDEINKPEQKDIDSWVRNDIEKIIHTLNEHKINIIMMNYPYSIKDSPFKSTYISVNENLKKISDNYKLPFIDNNQIFNDMGFKIHELMEPIEVGMHPTKKGYYKIAESVYLKIAETKMIN